MTRVGRYTLLTPLASGGMGTVHLATLADAGRTQIVAVKRLHPHLRNDQTFATMLLDEARLAVSIRHPNVVEVIDIVSSATELLLVMEYVAGLSVHELVKEPNGRRTAVPLPIAVRIAIDALHGLQAAHEALGDNGQPLGLIHRDVSPQNLLVDADGVTKLTDFGVAKAAGRLRSTHDGTIRGKIAYMSPEQVADTEIDACADIYSSGVVLWEMLAGEPMFEAESDVALFGKAMRGPTRRVADVAQGVPPAVDAAIWRALSRDPRRRHPSARAFADALADACTPAAHDAVVRWLTSRAAGILDERARLVAGILAHDDEANTITDFSIPKQPAPISLDSDVLQTDHGDVTAPPPTSSKRPDRRIAIALVGLGASSVVGLALLLGRGNQPTPQPEFPPEPALPAPTAEATEAPSSPTPTAEPEPRTRVTTGARPTTTVRSRAPAPAPKKAEKDAKIDCNPPYTEDEQGRHFKSWCLR